jgi:hypothetical protein
MSVSTNVARKIGFYPINNSISKFMSYSLYEMICKNTETKFLENAVKYCYRLDYKNLSVVGAEARDNFSDAIVGKHAESYVKQNMFSISGEQNDLCLYTYSPDCIRSFIGKNKHLHYTFMPLTVHATDSANGIRHDMLLIFDNVAKFIYWFDGKNREDYLPIGRSLPRNAIDVMFINMFEQMKLGYSYEPAPSWQIQGTLHPYGSIGLMDFALSMAWCYNIMISLNEYDSPTMYLSNLDTMSEVDRFHMLYNSMLAMLGVDVYHKVVPNNSSIDLTANRVVLNEVKVTETKVPSTVIDHKFTPLSDALFPTISTPALNMSSRTVTTDYIKLYDVNKESTDVKLKTAPIDTLNRQSSMTSFTDLSRPNHSPESKDTNVQVCTGMDIDNEENTNGKRRSHNRGSLRNRLMTESKSSSSIKLEPMKVVSSVEIAKETEKTNSKESCKVM